MAIATLRRFSLLTLLMGTLLSATQAAAEQMVRVGEYEIHYNAIETRFLNQKWRRRTVSSAASGTA